MRFGTFRVMPQHGVTQGYAVKYGFAQTVNRTLDFEAYHTYDTEGKMLSADFH